MGLDTDIGFMRAMTRAETLLYPFLGPTMVVRMMKFMWPHSIIVVVFASVVSTLVYCPTSLGNRVLHTTLLYLANFVQLCSEYDVSIRGLFLNAYSSIIAPFDQWEIAKGRRKRQRMPKLQLYQYRKPAKNRKIRLLKLRARLFFNEPSCELIEVSLNETPPFEAVSYTWGEKAPSIPIELDGKEILVTANVDDFLSHQRSIFGPKCFWIDAICINQDDNNEKNGQLPLVTDIYKSASRVIVWPEPPENSRETRVVRKMIMALNWPQPQVVGKTRGTKTRDLLLNLFRNEEETFVAVSKFLSHRYKVPRSSW
jgi:hypothetical protein